MLQDRGGPDAALTFRVPGLQYLPHPLWGFNRSRCPLVKAQAHGEDLGIFFSNCNQQGWPGFPMQFHWNPPALSGSPGTTGQEGRTRAKGSRVLFMASLLGSNLEGRQERISTTLSTGSGTSEAAKANIPSSVLQLLVPPSTLARLMCTLHASGRAAPGEEEIRLQKFL